MVKNHSNAPYNQWTIFYDLTNSTIRSILGTLLGPPFQSIIQLEVIKKL